MDAASRKIIRKAKKTPRPDRYWSLKTLKKSEISLDLYEKLKSVRHASFPEIVDIKENDETISIIKETFYGDNLETLLKTKGKMDPDKASRFIVSLTEAVCCLNAVRPDVTIYRDIAPQDILIDKTGEIKLTNLEALMTKSENMAQMGQIESLALLFYHLLTGNNPMAPNFCFKSFTELGIYLPGELFDVIEKAVMEKSLSMNDFMHGIQNIFSHQVSPDVMACNEAACSQQGSPKRIHWVAGILASVCIIVLLAAYSLLNGGGKRDGDSFFRRFAMNFNPSSQSYIPEVSPSAGNTPLPSATSDPSEEPAMSTPVPENTSAPASPSTHQQDPVKPTKPNAAKGTIYLSHLQATNIRKGYEGFSIGPLQASSDKDINGNKFKAGIKLQMEDNCLISYADQWMEAEYLLDGKYSKIKLCFTLGYDCRNLEESQKAWLNLFGDGKLLVSSGDIGSGSEPESLQVSVKGVKVLKVQLSPASQFIEDASYLIGDPILIP